MFDERSGRRLGASSVSQGSARRLPSAGNAITPDPRELDHQLGFDLGYRDGLARATAEVETAAVEARMAWEADAQARQDQAIAALESARAACIAAAEAMASACDDEREWATGIAVEIAYAGIVRLLGQRHADHELMGALCAAVSREVAERPLRLRVAPGDFDSVVAHVGMATVEADDRLVPGSCELDTPRGRLVAGVAERLTLLRDALLDGLAGTDAGVAG